MVKSKVLSRIKAALSNHKLSVEKRMFVISEVVYNYNLQKIAAMEEKKDQYIS